MIITYILYKSQGPRYDVPEYVIEKFTLFYPKLESISLGSRVYKKTNKQK